MLQGRGSTRVAGGVVHSPMCERRAPRRRAAARAGCAEVRAAPGVAFLRAQGPSLSPRRAGSLDTDGTGSFGRCRWTRTVHTRPRGGAGVCADGRTARPHQPLGSPRAACGLSCLQRGPLHRSPLGPKVPRRSGALPTADSVSRRASDLGHLRQRHAVGDGGRVKTMIAAAPPTIRCARSDWVRRRVAGCTGGHGCAVLAHLTVRTPARAPVPDPSL